MGSRTFWELTGLLAGATIGAGVFALPYFFAEAGWLTGFFYLIILSALLIFAHHLFARVLVRTGGRHHIVGLAQAYFGRPGFWIALGVVLCGLFLSLVAYLVLALSFIRALFPSVPEPLALFGFWLTVSLPLVFRLRRLVEAEFKGTILKALLILGLFLISPHSMSVFSLPPVRADHIALPFGPVLFALAGWTAIPAMVDFAKRRNTRALFGGIAWGTTLCAILYGCFVLGVLGFNPNVSTDVGSWFMSAAPFVGTLISLLGLFALWTVYVSISLEIKNSLEFDLRWGHEKSFLSVLILPLALIAAGLKSFLFAAALAGGVFLSMQYALIMILARRVLRLRGLERFFLDLVLLTFTLAALYEIYAFIVK